ncbi:hypothetical protein COCON_G00234170 [Conger conger]|uniref:Uncharacterized protein n=1 Tax=Conger conger TaxID=82655 RepID=A0A9Q1CUQ8_CONCO|nr:hypothetical protein COCON_G00234170 [Conger conger]
MPLSPPHESVFELKKMDSFMKMVAVALLVLSDPARVLPGSEESCTYRAVGESLTIDIQGQQEL